MAVVYLVIFLTSLMYSAAEHMGEGQLPCYQNDITNGRPGCKVLEGTFLFTKENSCIHRLYKNVEELYGKLVFDDISFANPMACLPRLKTIILPNKTPFNTSVAINITKSVRNMQNFTIHPNLVIYARETTWISIKAKHYRMDRKNYMILAGRFGSGRLDVDHEEDGECNIAGRTLYFLSELDYCTRVHGEMKIIEPKGFETITNLHEIDGCINIQSTNLELQHVYFLRNVKKIICHHSGEMFRGNPKLCIPKGYLKTLVSAYTDLSDGDKVELTRNTLESSDNKNIEGCGSTCVADDIEKEDEDMLCQTVVGVVKMRSSLVKKISAMEVLKGHLLIDGFGSPEPFENFPYLHTIEAIGPGPIVKITNNHLLRNVEIPLDLNVTGKSLTLFYVRDNYPYKMAREQYNKLAETYGEIRLSIDVLEKGECFLPDPINDLSILNNCSSITGDLQITNNVTGTTTMQIKKVTGCIIITDTNLTSLSFLNKIDSTSSEYCTRSHVISGNINLCPGFWLQKLMKTKNGDGYSILTSVGNKKICYAACTREDLYKSTNCESVNEGITISKRELGHFKNSLANIVSAKGTVSIKGTDMTNIELFPSLKSIISNDKYGDPAVDVQNNKHLEKIDFSALEEIETNNKTKKLIVIKNNGNYSMPKGQYKKLVEKFGEERLDIDHKTDPSLQYGIAIGIGGVLVCVIVAAVITMTVYLVKIRRGDRKSKENKKMKKKCGKEKKEDQKPLLGETKKKTPTKAKTPDQDDIQQDGDYDIVEFDNEATKTVGLNPAQVTGTVSQGVTIQTAHIENKTEKMVQGETPNNPDVSNAITANTANIQDGNNAKTAKTTTLEEANRNIEKSSAIGMKTTAKTANTANLE